MLRKLRPLALLGLCLIGGLLLGYQGWIASLAAQEASSPSTRQVLVTREGRTIPLAQPTVGPAAEAAGSALGAAPGAAPAPTPPPAPILPPERIRIPDLDLDWPVVLATTDHLPRFRGVGWLLGSAFPGGPGNLVLFGHRGGPNGTMMRLPELQPGALFSVLTEEREYRYKVRQIFETTPDDVAVLAPGAGATATLITCTGPWDAAAQTNALRLIVVADLVESPPSP